MYTRNSQFFDIFEHSCFHSLVFLLCDVLCHSNYVCYGSWTTLRQISCSNIFLRSRVLQVCTANQALFSIEMWFYARSSHFWISVRANLSFVAVLCQVVFKSACRVLLKKAINFDYFVILQSRIIDNRWGAKRWKMKYPTFGPFHEKFFEDDPMFSWLQKLPRYLVITHAKI